MRKTFLFLALGLLVAISANAKTIDLSSYEETYQIDVNNGDVITGKAMVRLRLTVNETATITLDNADINGDGSLSDASNPHAGITANYNLTIILKGKNYIQAFGPRFPGIFIDANKTLTIREHEDGGKLYARGGNYGAGIGGSDRDNCGNIKIFGGEIDARGMSAAGIGAGNGKNCGSIEIYGRDVSGRALNNPVACGAAGIGGAEGSTVTSIFIENVDDAIHKIYAERGTNAQYAIGKGKNGSVTKVEIQGIDVTYDSKAGIAATETNYYWYDGREAALLPKLNDVISEMVTLKTLVTYYEIPVPEADMKAFNTAITNAQAAQENYKVLSYEEMETAITTAQTALTTAETKLLATVKDAVKKHLDGMLVKGDSEACQKIVADAKAEVDAWAWNDTKDVSGNAALIETAVNKILKDTKAKLINQRVKDMKAVLTELKADVSALYEYAEDNDLSDELRGNLLTLIGRMEASINSTISSEEDYNTLVADYNDELIAYLGYLQALINENKALICASLDALLKEGDNDACKKIVADAKALVNAFTIDGDLSGIENVEAMDTQFSEEWFLGIKAAVEKARKETGINNQMVNGKCQNGKLIRNGHLYIQRGGEIFNANGARVK